MIVKFMVFEFTSNRFSLSAVGDEAASAASPLADGQGAAK
jgi:hypothetical protein